MTAGHFDLQPTPLAYFAPKIEWLIAYQWRSFAE
jgi:hypothetical protein